MIKKLALIVPCYNEQETIPIFYREASLVLEKMGCSYEILFVNDGSTDQTLKVLRELAWKDENVSFISFSRNFGKEAAMFAGFCNSDASYTAVMDVDMQDPPSLLPRMLDILETTDYDSVATRREDRKGEPPVRSWFAHRFYRIINRISDADIVDGARDFRLMRRDMVDAIVAMNEYNRFSKGIFGWVGFNTYWLTYQNVERAAGESKWNFWKLTKYAIDGIINFSQTPLMLASWGGIAMTFLSFLALAFLILRKLIFGDSVQGWASTICIMVFIGGIQLFCLGIIGQYIAKMYLETKKRPHYIISETNKSGVEKIR